MWVKAFAFHVWNKIYGLIGMKGYELFLLSFFIFYIIGYISLKFHY